MPFKPVETKKVYMRVVEQIRGMIDAGELSPGDQLPTTHELADAMQVSRPSVREALAALEILGMVDSRPGSGCYVRTPPAPVAQQELKPILSSWASAEDILEARLAYEPVCARLAAVRHTKSDLEEMRCTPEMVMVDIERVAIGLPARFTDCQAPLNLPPADFQISLHAVISRSSQNPVLAAFGKAISEAVRSPTWQKMMRQIYLSPKNSSYFFNHYESLYDAIAARDAKLAESIMREHLLALSATLND